MDLEELSLLVGKYEEQPCLSLAYTGNGYWHFFLICHSFLGVVFGTSTVFCYMHLNSHMCSKQIIRGKESKKSISHFHVNITGRIPWRNVLYYLVGFTQEQLETKHSWHLN